MMQVDLEVDSNNNGSIEGTNSAEDDAENQAGATGKIFGVNDGDRNINGVTDMLEVGYSQDFTPIELELRTKVPLEDLVVRFLYNGAALQTTNGAMRIWKKNGSDNSRVAADYIQPDPQSSWAVSYAPSALGFTASGERRTFYLEGIQPGAQEIAIEMAYSNVSKKVNFQNKTQRQPQMGKDAGRVTVIKVDLEIYKPKVIDAAEPMIPDTDKLSKGSVTFVNLDNDDGGTKFDNDPTKDEVVGGDDELVKIKLKLKPSNLAHGEVKLLVTEGASNIAVWTNSNKEASYVLGTVLNVPGDFVIEGDCLVKTMWVEGVSAHTAQQGTKLKMAYTISNATCEDEASLTVIGVDKITWKGKGNSINDDDNLTEDTNWPGGLTPNALRIFPGARVVSGSVETHSRDKVTAEVMLTVKPPHPIKLYLKSFDTDDPTADSSPVDDETNEDDNRGMSPAQAGQFTGESGGVLELVFPENVKTTNCEFQVTIQPGDNFRIVANGDKDFLSQLENKDSAAGATDADKQRICNKDVTGTPEDREVRLSGNYASDVLTVWRFLHVEVVSMAAPPTMSARKTLWMAI